jgi:hypothetical protein
MRHSELSTLLSATIPAKLPVLIKGPPGVGKTDAVKTAATATGADLIVSHPVVSDPTDAKGLPWKAEGRDAATFLPFGDLEQALSATKPTVWFLDDLGQATPAVQASFMHLILAREVAGHKLPDHIVFAAATNRREDRAGVSGILEPVKSRFATIVELEANLDDWLTWANNSGINPMICAFLMFKPTALHDFTATADLTNSPSPRTWAAAAKLIDLGMPPYVEFMALEGCIGKGAATEFSVFQQTWAALPSIPEIFMNPQGAPIPDSPAGLFAVCSALAHQVNGATFGAMSQYLERLPNEFLVLGMKNAQERNALITRTPAFLQWATSPKGRALFGASGV